MSHRIAVPLTAAFCLVHVIRASAADVSIKPGDQIIQIQVRDDQQARQLEELDLDIHSHEVGVGPVDVHVSIGERNRLDELGFEYSILNPDLEATYASEQADILLRSGLANPFDGYLNIDDSYAFMNSLVNARPDLIEELPSIGLSIELRPIRVWRITGPNKADKPAVFFHGLQHCREWITGPMILYIADQLVNGYDSNPALQALVNRADVYLMPVANPDGYAYTWQSSSTRLWRKNRRNNGDGTFGVDLNRNWAHGWGGGGSSSTTSSETYRGTGPFSEPETQAYSNFISSKPNIRGYMDYHSYSQYIMWAYGGTCTTLPEPEYSRWYAIGLGMHKNVQDTLGVFYEPGPICQTIYQASGASVDWVYGTAGRPMAATIELRDTGTFGFQLPASQILPNCQENFPAIMHLTEWATAGLTILLDDPAGVVVADQATNLKLRIYANIETFAGGTLYYRNAGNGAYASTPIVPVSGVNYSATIPAFPCGQSVEFYVEVTGNQGFVTHYPNTFPVSDPESNTVIWPVVQTMIFADDFQNNLGWTTSAVGATLGLWQRGVPVNDLSNPHDPISDSDRSGMCYLTQNGTGSNTDVDNGTVILTSPTLDLTPDDIRLSFDYYLRLSNVTGGVDRLLVEIDENNGAGPWKQLALVTADGGVSWRRIEIDQADLNAAGVVLTSTMKLRFSVNDANTQSTVEGGIDAVRITSGACATIPCQGTMGDMDNNGTVDGGDIQAFLNAGINSPFFDPCADLAAPNGVLDEADTVAFVDMLLAK